MPRKPISKSLRFRVFERDQFTCQYCGSKPPEVVLQIDHSIPVSKGGSNEELNLITACSACNGGKSNRLLGGVLPTPDADLRYLEAAQKSAELERYLQESKNLEILTAAAIARLKEVWIQVFDGEYVPKEKILRSWLNKYDPLLIQRAIEACGPAAQAGRISEHNFNGMLRYVGATLRNLEIEGAA